ncbi:MAG: hypothetical protein AB7Q42_21240 [Acidimicrobiia bacterium]
MDSFTLDRLDRLALEADRIADGLESATLPRAAWTHRAHVLAATALVRRHGAAEALARLRLAIPRYNEATGTPNTDTSGYHDTLTVFYTWAIERLVAGGLSTLAILWHPLTSPGAPLSWWDRETLFSREARRTFVPSTLALPGDPAPHGSLLAAGHPTS